jgi:hypothetical protein
MATAAVAGIVTAVVAVVGAGVTAYSAIQQGNDAAAMARYQAQVAENNQVIAEQNARLAQASGEAKINQEQLKTRAIVGALKAKEAASGIDVNTGSAVDVRSSAAELGELNVLTTRSNVAREAYGYETQSQNFGDQSKLDQAQASNAETSGAIRGASSLLSGAWSYAQQFGFGGSTQTDEGLNFNAGQRTPPSNALW